jgi:hypothetical protein
MQIRQELSERRCHYLGRSLEPRVGCIEKSAEVIVLGGNDKGKTLMVSQVRKDGTTFFIKFA